MGCQRAVAIVNPAASSGGAAKAWPGVEHALKRHFSNVEVRATEAPGHATSLCREALERGADFIVSVGGDGTTNEVLGGFVGPSGDNRFPDVPLGIVAAGTGGDFQRQFGVTRPLRQVQRMAEAEVRTVDYGVVEFTDHEGVAQTRAFLNVSSIGVSGLVVRYVQDASRAFGPTAAYVGSSLRGIVNWRNRPCWIRFDDGDPVRHDLTLLIAGNGQYFGAGMWACPNARFDDGVFDYTMLTGMTRLQISATLAKVFRGKHLRVRGVHSGQARRIEVRPVDPEAELLLDVDGEQPGRAPCSYRIVPHGLRIRIA